MAPLQWRHRDGWTSNGNGPFGPLHVTVKQRSGSWIRRSASLPDGASLVAQILEADPIAPRSVRPVMEFCAQQRRLLRDLQALSARCRLGDDARLLRRAATVLDELVRLIEQVADLQVSLPITTPAGQAGTSRTSYST